MVHLYVGEAPRPLSGELVIPSSKYHAHRALMLASLARGTSQISGRSDAGHVRSTIRVLRDLGIDVEIRPDGFLVHGGRYRPRTDVVSVGSSGTTLYFMLGLASLATAPVTFTGQKYFQRRPIAPLLAALTQLGVQFELDEPRPPITVQPSRPTGGRVTIDGTLSQWISGLLMVSAFASGPSTIEVEGELNEQPYIELTVRMMRQFGLEIDVADDWRRFEVAGGQEARPATLALPPDIGSAAFGLAATALHPSDVVFHGLVATRAAQLDHPEAHFLDVLREMGLPLALDRRLGAVRVRHRGIQLRGVHVDCRPMPDMLPILATLGAYAHGTTVCENIAHVRLKESDRIVSMLQLNRMGADVVVDDTRLVVRGSGAMTGAALSSYNDHRVQMALAVAASRARGASSLTYPNAHRISYPTFLDDMRTLGIPMSVARVPPRAGDAPPRTSRTTPAVGVSVAIDQAAKLPISEWLARWARERPAGIAIIDTREDASRMWSWSALDEAVDRTASLLLDLGVQPGESVAYQLPNWAEFVIVTLATLRIGAVCCPLMPIFRAREITQALGRSRARTLIIPDRFCGRDYRAETATLLEEAALWSDPPIAVEHVIVVAGETGAGEAPSIGGTVRWHDFAAATADRPVDAAALEARRPAADALAQLLFTSGTTGEPKGVLHRFDSLTRAAAMAIEHLRLGRDDRIFVPSPLAHQTGFLYGMWLALVLGSTQILQDVWEPLRAARTLREHGGSFVQAATPFLSDLLRVVDDGASPPSSLRLFVVTGATVPRVLAERAARVLDATICGAWGSTESCLGALALPGDRPENVWGTDGRELAGTRMRITGEDGSVLGPNEVGNLEVFSGCMFAGYVDQPELTAAAFTPDGWYRSGDLATLDADGNLRVSGRVKDIINRGGEKIPVSEIEQLLHEHPHVDSAAIVAMPDDRLGERACAFVVLKEGAELEFRAMQEYFDCLQVSKHYWPERLELIDCLPRNAVGKVQKHVLRERARNLTPMTDSQRVV